MSSDHDDGQEMELVEPFDIDRGELEGIRPQVVFSMGVEWEMLRHELDTGRAVSRTIHVQNTERIRRMCLRRGRSFEIEPHDDQWSFLRVEAM